MDWTQTITIFATVIGSGYYIHRDLNKAMKIQSEKNDKLSLDARKPDPSGSG